MFIRTQRLFLRPVFPEDWRAVLAGMSDGSVPRMIARAPWPYRAEDAIEYCRAAPSRGPFVLAVTLPGEKGAPLIGQAGLAPFDPERDGDALELGYWIAPGRRGRGYAREAAGALIASARALGVRRIVAGHFLDNPASGKVLRACGFRETGEIRPVACRGRGGALVLSRRYALGPASGSGRAAECLEPAM